MPLRITPMASAPAGTTPPACTPAGSTSCSPTGRCTSSARALTSRHSRCFAAWRMARPSRTCRTEQPAATRRLGGGDTMRRSHVSAATLICLAVVGCGGDGLRRVAVQGKVTAKGVPLDQAVLQFLPTGATQGEGGIGRSDHDGNFSLTGTRAGATGVVPGEYKIRVSRLVARDGTTLPPDAKQAENPGARESVPAPYSSLEGTPLKATVPEAGGVVNLDIPADVVRRP